MKVTIIKGPLYEFRKEEAQKLLFSIIMKKAREQCEEAIRITEAKEQ